MALSDARIQSARHAGSSAVEAALSPLITEYDKRYEAVISSQKSIAAGLDAVMQELERVQQNAPKDGDDPLNEYTKKVLDLRQRMDSVAFTMKRVHIRLDSLQSAVGRHEQIAAQRRKAEAAIEI